MVKATIKDCKLGALVYLYRNGKYEAMDITIDHMTDHQIAEFKAWLKNMVNDGKIFVKK